MTFPIKTSPKIRTYSSAMVWQMETQLYTSFTTTLNFYEVDVFSIDFNPGQIDEANFAIGGFLSFQTADMPDPKVFLIEAKTFTRSPVGKSVDNVNVTGRGVKAVLDFRRHISLFNTGTGYDTQTSVTYEAAMRNFLSHEIIAPSDANRTMTGITFYEANMSRGGTVDAIQKRTESVLDTIVEMSKVSTLGVELVWSGAGRNFTVKFVEGTDRSTVGDPTCVTLSEGIRNVKGFTYSEDSTQQKNVAYVGGTGDAAARNLEKVLSGAEATGWDRREAWVDASNCTTDDQLIQEGETALVEASVIEDATFTYNPVSPSTTFGVDFNLGDIVNVVFPTVATLTARIISVTWTFNASGTQLEMVAGKKRPDFVRILKSQFRNVSSGGKH